MTPLFSVYSLSQGVPHFKTKHETKFFFLWFTILYLIVPVVLEPERGLAVGSNSQSSEGWIGVEGPQLLTREGFCQQPASIVLLECPHVMAWGCPQAARRKPQSLYVPISDIMHFLLHWFKGKGTRSHLLKRGITCGHTVEPPQHLRGVRAGCDWGQSTLLQLCCGWRKTAGLADIPRLVLWHTHSGLFPSWFCCFMLLSTFSHVVL